MVTGIAGLFAIFDSLFIFWKSIRRLVKYYILNHNILYSEMTKKHKKYNMEIFYKTEIRWKAQRDTLEGPPRYAGKGYSNQPHDPSNYSLAYSSISCVILSYP